MASTQLTVETVPAAVFVEERATGRRLDFSFEIRNRGANALELVAIEQDVYGEDGSLIQRRTVDEDAHIGSGERRTFSNPLPEFAAGTPLALLVYTFAFRTLAGDVRRWAIRVSPIERSAQMSAAPLVSEPAGDEEHAVPPTPRQLARAWFETLYELGTYATPALTRP